MNLAVIDDLYFLSALHISLRDVIGKDISSGATQLNKRDLSLV
jgi:hypothetical protein